LAIADRWPEQFIPDAELASLAESLRILGHRAEALEALRRSIQIRTAMLERNPTHFVRRLDLLRSRNQLAGLLLEMGDRDGAMAEYRQALTMAEEMASAHPDHLLARRDLADTYEGLGRYYEREDRRQAREWYQKSLDIWTAWPGSSTRMDQGHRDRAAKAVARAGQ
jgi:tetratricopeptide (TPR) repeat protein